MREALEAELSKPVNEFKPDWDTLQPYHDRIAELEAQLALEKKANNARELGLDYEPEQEPVDIHCPSCLHSFSVVPCSKAQPEQEPIQAINDVIDYLYSTGADNDMANRAHIALKQLQMNLRDQTALHLLYKGDYEDLIAQPEQDKDNLNETNQALIELCEALNDALVEVCSANPKIEISRKHDQRIKNATAKIKEFT